MISRARRRCSRLEHDQRLHESGGRQRPPWRGRGHAPQRAGQLRRLENRGHAHGAQQWVEGLERARRNVQPGAQLHRAAARQETASSQQVQDQQVRMQYVERALL